MSVAVGDTVLVPEYGGTKLTFDEQVLHLCIVFLHNVMCLHAGVVLCMQCVHVMCRTEYYLCKNSMWLNVDTNDYNRTSVAKID